MSKANEPWPKHGLAEGTKVITSDRPKTPSTEWTEEALRQRRWNVSGEVIDFSDAHGLCLKVRHSDNTTAYYDPTELTVA